MARPLRKVFHQFSESILPISRLMREIEREVPPAFKKNFVRERQRAIRNAAVVLLSGFLESFIREMAEAYVTEVKGQSIPIRALSDEMLETHFIAGLGEALQAAKDDKRDGDRSFARATSVMKQLDIPANDLASSLLYWKAFSATRANPGPGVLADFLRNFGVKDPLAKVATTYGVSESLLRTKLESFIALRNECAHTGSTSQTPLPSEIREFVHFLRSIALGISKVLEKQLSEIEARVRTSAAASIIV